MDTIRKRLIHIHSCRGVGWKTIYKFLQYDSSLETIYELKLHEFREFFRMKSQNAEAFYNDLHSTNIETILCQYENNNLMILTIMEPDYPALLKQIYDPPWVLYLQGNKTLLDSPCLSVVGTRHPSKYGYDVMKKILPPIIRNNITIVSGLALGIDTMAHQITIKEKGKTIAVLGAGFHHIYPSQNKHLAHEISTNHLLLSEFPPRKKPEKWHFPLRNRIISGISKGTLIIEAKERSGSLITAEQALEQGRDVFAIPGSIFEPRNQGTNSLIQHGAKLVMNATNIIEEF